MTLPSPDLATQRYLNALALFDEFVRATVSAPDAATLRGLERRFAERVEIQPSYWSQIKSRSRQIGERLARQFEQRCGKPVGWLDQPHAADPGRPVAPAATTPVADPGLPRDDDERFITGLVLSYYRRNPRQARQHLLELLGEVLLTPPPPAPPKPQPIVVEADEGRELWARMGQSVAPLKKRR